MNMKKVLKISFLSIIGLQMMSACSEITDMETSNDYIVMAVDQITRGTQAMTATLNSGFGVSCSAYPAADTYTNHGCGSYFYKELVTPNTPTRFFWPTSDYRVSFFAYYPYGNSAFTVQSTASTNGSPVYAYTVPTAIASQADIMTAQVVNRSCSLTEVVPLSFAHNCADIRFNVYNRGTSSITLHSIGVYGVKYSGTLHDGVWTLNAATNTTSSNPFLLTLGSTIEGEATIDVTGSANHFILLPQTVAAGTQMIDVDATVGGQRQHYYHSLENSLTLQAGKTYNISIQLGENGIIVDPESDISDWTSETKYLSVSDVTTNGTFTQPSVTDGQVMGVEDWTEEE